MKNRRLWVPFGPLKLGGPGGAEKIVGRRPQWKMRAAREGYKLGTPPKTNMEPENEPLEEEIPVKNHHF